MTTINIRLFGKLRISRGENLIHQIDAPKLQELLSYLLLFRDHPHSREKLAGLFWGNQSLARSKKYLRQALWQIQSALAVPEGQGGFNLLNPDPNWVILNSTANLWIDVVEFEQTFNLLQRVPAPHFDAQSFESLSRVAELYQGDLLEGCYQDWCLFERERLQNMYLAILDKLMDYCEARHTYDAGLAYGMRSLRYDRIRERTHRKLMRLYHYTGNRTEALRQYQRCANALKEELGVQPSRQTVDLYEQIRSDLLEDQTQPRSALRTSEIPTKPLSELLSRLKQLHRLFHSLQEEILEDIRSVERALNGKR